MSIEEYNASYDLELKNQDFGIEPYNASYDMEIKNQDFESEVV